MHTKVKFTLRDSILSVKYHYVLKNSVHTLIKKYLIAKKC